MTGVPYHSKMCEHTKLLLKQSIIFTAYLFIITMHAAWATSDGNHHVIHTTVVEELPRGSLVNDLVQHLQSFSTNQDVRFSDFHIVANSPVINSIFHVEPENGRIVTARKIDRDTLCQKDDLCCQTSDSFPVSRSHDLFRIEPTRSSTAFRPTIDQCQLVFRVIYKQQQLKHNQKQHSSSASPSSSSSSTYVNRTDTGTNMVGKMGYQTIVIDIKDVNDNQPHFILPSSRQSEMKNDHSGMRTITTSPLASIEMWIDESEALEKCFALPTAIDEDSSKYGTAEYRLERANAAELLPITRGMHTTQPHSTWSTEMENLPFAIVQSDCELASWDRSRTILATGHSGLNNALNPGSSNAPFLKLINKLDRERVDEYWMQILAVDGHGFQPQTGLNRASNPSIRHTGTLLLRVRVRDANDNSPSVPSSVDLHVQEDASIGHVVGLVSATDADIGDNGRLQYQIGLEPAQLANFPLRINPTTGAILVSKGLDADRLPVGTNRQLRFKVIVQDAGKPIVLRATSEVTVALIDVNDETPQIRVVDLNSQSSPPRPTVLENQPAGQLIAFVTASDADSGLYGTLRCHVNNAKFQLDPLNPTAGLTASDVSDTYTFDQSIPRQTSNTVMEFKLTTTMSLDRESIPMESIEIVCTDQSLTATDVRTGRVRFVVTVLDENDNPPIWESDEIRLKIMENEPPNQLITVLNATDADQVNHPGRNKFAQNIQWSHKYSTSFIPESLDASIRSDRIRYALDKAGEEYFRLDAVTGALYSQVKFDREQLARIQFNVTAIDSGNPPRNASARVIVDILDRNDNAPLFEQQAVELQLREDSLVNSVVLNLTARDSDSGINGQVVYQMEDIYGMAQRQFHLNSEDGTLKLRKPLDREKHDRYRFKVYATDRGLPKQSAVCTVTIIVQDVNDNAPKFVYPTQKNHTIYASVHTSPGIPLVKLTAVDPDDGENARLRFILDGEPEHAEIFSLNQFSGELVLIGSADPEALEGKYELKLRVEDSGQPVLSGTAMINIILNRTPPTLTDHLTGLSYREGLLGGDADRLRSPSPALNTHGFGSARSDWRSSSKDSTTTGEEALSTNRSIQRSMIYFTSERALIVVICLIAVSALIAFIFLVVITLIRRRSAALDADSVRSSLGPGANSTSGSARIVNQYGSKKFCTNHSTPDHKVIGGPMYPGNGANATTAWVVSDLVGRGATLYKTDYDRLDPGQMQNQYSTLCPVQMQDTFRMENRRSPLEFDDNRSKTLDYHELLRRERPVANLHIHAPSPGFVAYTCQSPQSPPTSSLETTGKDHVSSMADNRRDEYVKFDDTRLDTMDQSYQKPIDLQTDLERSIPSACANIRVKFAESVNGRNSTSPHLAPSRVQTEVNLIQTGSSDIELGSSTASSPSRVAHEKRRGEFATVQPRLLTDTPVW